MAERDDNAPHPIELTAHAASKVGVDFYRAFRDANSGDPRREVRGLVQMTVLNMREGEFPVREFQRLPVHLPDTEREMRVLALSKTPADQPMRTQLYAWATANRDHHVKATVALVTAAAAFHRASAVLADESCTDEELGLWCDQMVAFVLDTWKVALGECPKDPKDAETWARDVVGRFNITPDWLTETGKPPSLFEPSKHRPKAGNPFRSRGYGGDDD